MANFDALLEKFNERMKKYRVRLHGAVLMSGKEVVGEIYNRPYTAETKTRMYSVSKSVVAVAIGRLVGEGKLSLDERIVDIFADRFDMSGVHPWLKEQTVRHMLRMTTVYSRGTYTPKESNWLESYFGAIQPTHPCGTVWNYDSSGSYVLGAIVKHRTGKDFVEYLRPVFDEIGVSDGVYCFAGPDGEAWAPSAFMATTADIAKIAYLLLENGEWNGKSLIPKDYAKDAVSPLERNDDGGDSDRFLCGYGYQIWSYPEGAFSFRGLGGQVAIAFPGRDLVFACNSDTAGNINHYEAIFNAVEDIILPEFSVIDCEKYNEAQPKAITENIFESIKNKNFIISDGTLKIESLRLEGDGCSYELYYKIGGKEYCLPFSTQGETEIIFPQKYTGAPLFDKDSYMNYKCSIVGEWLTPSKLYVKVWAEDIYVGNASICLAFRDDGKIGVKAIKNAQFFFDDFNGFAGGEAEKE